MSRSQRITRALFAAVLVALASLPAPAVAGMALGPYLIWVNLAGDASADEAIHVYTHAEPDADSCWNSQAFLQYLELPHEITPRLVRSAVVLHDVDAKKRLLAALKRGEEGVEAFDGVVVVPKSGTPMLMSLSASGRIRSSPAVDKAGTAIWSHAFCAVLPPISRKP